MSGSLWILALAVALAGPIGIGAGIYLHEFAPAGRGGHSLGVMLRGLSEASPLLAGLALLGLGLGPGVAAALALSLVLVPRLIRATFIALGGVDPRIRRAAESLGATPLEALRTLVLPAAGALLATRCVREVARAAGEAAPLVLLSASETLAWRAQDEPGVAVLLVVAVVLANGLAGRVERRS